MKWINQHNHDNIEQRSPTVKYEIFPKLFYYP